MEQVTSYMNTAIESELFGDTFQIAYSINRNKVTLRKNGKIIALLESMEEAKKEYELYKSKHYGQTK